MSMLLKTCSRWLCVAGMLFILSITVHRDLSAQSVYNIEWAENQCFSGHSQIVTGKTDNIWLCNDGFYDEYSTQLRLGRYDQNGESLTNLSLCGIASIDDGLGSDDVVMLRAYPASDCDPFSNLINYSIAVYSPGVGPAVTETILRTGNVNGNIGSIKIITSEDFGKYLCLINYFNTTEMRNECQVVVVNAAGVLLNNDSWRWNDNAYMAMHDGDFFENDVIVCFAIHDVTNHLVPIDLSTNNFQVYTTDFSDAYLLEKNNGTTEFAVLASPAGGSYELLKYNYISVTDPPVFDNQYNSTGNIGDIKYDAGIFYLYGNAYDDISVNLTFEQLDEDMLLETDIEINGGGAGLFSLTFDLKTDGNPVLIAQAFDQPGGDIPGINFNCENSESFPVIIELSPPVPCTLECQNDGLILNYSVCPGELLYIPSADIPMPTMTGDCNFNYLYLEGYPDDSLFGPGVYELCWKLESFIVGKDPSGSQMPPLALDSCCYTVIVEAVPPTLNCNAVLPVSVDLCVGECIDLNAFSFIPPPIVNPAGCTGYTRRLEWDGGSTLPVLCGNESVELCWLLIGLDDEVVDLCCFNFSVNTITPAFDCSNVQDITLERCYGDCIVLNDYIQQPPVTDMCPGMEIVLVQPDGLPPPLFVCPGDTLRLCWYIFSPTQYEIYTIWGIFEAVPLDSCCMTIIINEIVPQFDCSLAPDITNVITCPFECLSLNLPIPSTDVLCPGYNMVLRQTNGDDVPPYLCGEDTISLCWYLYSPLQWELIVNGTTGVVPTDSCCFTITNVLNTPSLICPTYAVQGCASGDPVIIEPGYDPDYAPIIINNDSNCEWGIEYIGPDEVQILDGTNQFAQKCYALYYDIGPDRHYYDSCCVTIRFQPSPFTYDCPPAVFTKTIPAGQCHYTFAPGEIPAPTYGICQADTILSNLPDDGTLAVGSHPVCYYIYYNNQLIDSCCFTVVVVPEDLTIEAADATCVGAPYTLEVFPKGIAYQWTVNNTVVGNSDILTIGTLPEGTQEVCVDVTYATGQDTCAQSICKNVTVRPTPVPVIFTNAPLCAGLDLVLNVTPVGPDFTHVWTLPDGTTSLGSLLVISDAQTTDAGIYSVEVTNAFLCSATASIDLHEIVEVPVPVPFDDIEVCQGETIGPLALSAMPDFTNIQWTNSNTSIGLDAAGSNAIPVFTAMNPSGSDVNTSTITWFPIMAQHGITCTGDTDTFQIMVKPSPALIVSATPNPVCSGGDLTLNASGGDTYMWTGPSDQLQDLPTVIIRNIAVAEAGTYTVRGVNEFNCVQQGSVDVNVHQKPVAVISPATDPVEVCLHSPLMLMGSGGDTYEWHFGAMTTTGAVYSIQSAALSDAGAYTLIATTTAGCADTTVAGVVVHPLPEVTIVADKSLYNDGLYICKDDTVNVRAVVFTDAIIGYQWQLDMLDIPLAVDDVLSMHNTGGSLTLMVIDTNNCENTSAGLDVSTGHQVAYEKNIRLIDCTSLTSGAVQLTHIEGQQPVLIELSRYTEPLLNLEMTDNNQGFVDFDNLAQGNYALFARDTLGCTWQDTIELDAPPANVLAVNDTLPFNFSSPTDVHVLINDLKLGNKLSSNDVILVPNDVYYDPFLLDLANNPGILPKNHDALVVDDMGTKLLGNVYVKEKLGEQFIEFYYQGFKNDFYSDTFRFNYQILDKSCLFQPSVATVVLINENTCVNGTENFINTITPNGDGKNDFLVIPWFPECDLINFEFAVYSRWGEAVFRQDDVHYQDIIKNESLQTYSNLQKFFWDGKNNNGADLPGGTYYYIIKYSYQDSKDGGRTKTGVIKNFVELIPDFTKG